MSRTAQCSILVGAVLVSTALGVGQAAGQLPEEKTGPKVGTKAPTFTLKDQAGNDRSLDEFLKKGKVVLVFYRSAEW